MAIQLVRTRSSKALQRASLSKDWAEELTTTTCLEVVETQWKQPSHPSYLGSGFWGLQCLQDAEMQKLAACAESNSTECDTKSEAWNRIKEGRLSGRSFFGPKQAWSLIWGRFWIYIYIYTYFFLHTCVCIILTHVFFSD